jgi:hypothetical protein
MDIAFPEEGRHCGRNDTAKGRHHDDDFYPAAALMMTAARSVILRLRSRIRRQALV